MLTSSHLSLLNKSHLLPREKFSPTPLVHQTRLPATRREKSWRTPPFIVSTKLEAINHRFSRVLSRSLFFSQKSLYNYLRARYMRETLKKTRRGPEIISRLLINRYVIISSLIIGKMLHFPIHLHNQLRAHVHCGSRDFPVASTRKKNIKHCQCERESSRFPIFD